MRRGQMPEIAASYQHQSPRAFSLFLLASLLLHLLLSLAAIRLLPGITRQLPDSASIIMVNLTPPMPQKPPAGQTVQPPKPVPVIRKIALSKPVQTAIPRPVKPAAVPPRHTQPVAETASPEAPHNPARENGSSVSQQTVEPVRMEPKAPSGVAAAKQEQPAEMTFGSASGPAFNKQVVPVYPAQARRRGKEGSVLLRISISETGKLTKIEVLEDPGYGFTEAALEAVRNSSFRPARHNGVPFAVRATLPIRFTLR